MIGDSLIAAGSRLGPYEILVFLEPSGIDVYLRAAEIFRGLRSRGMTVRSTIDCVPVAIAEESACEILARDRDIESVLRSGSVNARAWRFPAR